MSGKSIVSSRNATRVKGLKYVGTLADGEVWVFQSSSGNMIPGTAGGGGGSNLYTADGTIGTGRVATLADTLTLSLGSVNNYGLKFREGLTDLGGIIRSGANEIALTLGTGANTTALRGGGTGFPSIIAGDDPLNIGTATVSNRLVVKCTGNIKGLSLEGSTGYHAARLTQHGTTGTLFQLGNSANPVGVGGESLNLTSLIGSVNWIANDSNNLGVGIVGATAKLHIKGTGITSGTTALLVQNNVGTNLLEAKDDGSSILSGTLTVDSTSSIPLIVDGGSNSYIQFKVVGSPKMEFGYLAGHGYIYTPSATNLDFYIGSGSKRGTYFSNGNLRIGTGSDSGHKLQAVGSAKIDGAFDVNGGATKLVGAGTGSTDVLLAQTSALNTSLQLKNNGDIGLYGATPVAQPTTGIGSSIISAGVGTAAKLDDTFDGYTMAQVVKALRDIGVLA